MFSVDLGCCYVSCNRKSLNEVKEVKLDDLSILYCNAVVSVNVSSKLAVAVKCVLVGVSKRLHDLYSVAEVNLSVLVSVTIEYSFCMR